MIERELCGERVGRLGLGAMRLPVRGLLRSIDREVADRMVDLALEGGVRYFDTAWFYHLGRSEGFLGSSLARHPRDSWRVATKYYYPGFPDPRKVFEAQLSRLGVECVDFYLLHSLRDPYFERYFERGRLEYLLARQRAGQISHLGFSSHLSPGNLERVASMRDWDFAQIQLNYYDWHFGTARREYEVLSARGIPIVVMEPLRGGRLARLRPEAEAPLRAVHPDWEPAEWALRWVKGLPNVKVVLSGMSTPGQVSANVAAFSDERALDARELAALEESCGASHAYLAAPCTGCGYCTEACPRAIAVPQVMDAYNEWHASGSLPAPGTPASGFADCVGCGACSSRCPQSIPVPDLMAELAEASRRA